jgi:hypothetical protein
MFKKKATETRDRMPASPGGGTAVEEAESVSPTATALAGEAAATGVVPLTADRGREEIPGRDGQLQAGDPDTRALDSEYVGDTAPGGHMTTPDQGGVDDIGRAMGVQEEDGGELHASSEILDRRDRHRAELEPPGRPPSAYDPDQH